MLTYKGRRLMITIVLALITAGTVFFAVQTMYGSSYDPYENRADGAYGVCPVESWDSNGEGSSVAIYNCETEDQRQEAASIAATNHTRMVNGMSLLATATLTPAIVLIARTIVVNRVLRAGLKISK